MQFKIFTVAHFDSQATDELNHFISNNKVRELEQKFYHNETGGFWSFCIRYIPSAPVGTFGNQKVKVDYKAELSPEIFQIFDKLRKCRKLISNVEGLPPYNVFYDDELAEIAKLPSIDKNNISAINGINPKRAEKFGQRIAEMFTSEMKENEKVGEQDLTTSFEPTHPKGEKLFS